jgi:hypothetical protein
VADRYLLMQYLSDSGPASETSDVEPEVIACPPVPSGSEQSGSWPTPVDDTDDPIQPFRESQQRSRITSIPLEVIPE